MPTMGNDPRKFIRHNLLTLGRALDNPAQDLVRRDGTMWVTLEDVTANYETVKRTRNRKGLARLVARTNETWWNKPTRVYQVVSAAEGTADAFLAYVCPYVGNFTCFKMLGAQADVMFTSDMDGCTFGIGIPNRDGAVLVAHTNAQDKATGDQFNPNYAPQRAAQRTNLARGKVGGRMLEPDNYRDGAPIGKEFKAVTIGLRIGGKWEFWFQHQVCDWYAWREMVATTKIQ
jgi:hypothetical protein